MTNNWKRDMQTVFISYSHGDAAFVERLIEDLEYSEVRARYDRWILNVGDSILAKLAEEVSVADKIIAVLSPRSVQSTWVRKELALAMAGEMSSAQTKVLPALIEDCTLPDMLIDKVYADFRAEYYHGLFAILRALQPEAQVANISNLGAPKLVEMQAGKRELLRLLNCGDIAQIRTWMERNSYIFKGVIGPTFRSIQIIPHLEVDGGLIDLAIVATQSGRTDISLVLLGSPSLETRENLDVAAVRLSGAVRWCSDNIDLLRHKLLLRMRSGMRRMTSSAHISGTIVIGRRSEYGSDENNLRNEMYKTSGRHIDVMSYDRLIDAYDRLLRSAPGE
jgi:TIR domain